MAGMFQHLLFLSIFLMVSHTYIGICFKNRYHIYGLVSHFPHLYMSDIVQQVTSRQVTLITQIPNIVIFIFQGNVLQIKEMILVENIIIFGNWVHMCTYWYIQCLQGEILQITIGMEYLGKIPQNVTPSFFTLYYIYITKLKQGHTSS